MRLTAILLAFLFTSECVFAQKVSLVLSGGGAKGLAYVGVLKALEENNIPIDNVVGTSMGGVIGGFYAAGFSAIEIEEIVTTETFQDWVSGQLSDRYNYYYTKEDENPSWVNLNVNVDSSFATSFNPNIASDLSLNFAFTELLASANQISRNNFDSLFVPFRTVASEILTQEQVILKSGQLNDALRATMTVPFFFRPIKIDGRFLFDGGIYNNFPVDIAQNEFEPDVVLGVNVSSKRFNEYPEKDDEKLIQQTLLFMFLDKSDPSSVGPTGVYIEPQLEELSSFDFDKVDDFIELGYTATIEKMPEIKNKISKRETQEERSQARAAFLSKAVPLRFQEIYLEGFKKKQERYVKQLFHIDKKNRYIGDVKDSYFKMASEDFFSQIYPNILYDSASESFAFQIKNKPQQKLSFQVGGNLSTRSISQLYLATEYTFLGSLLQSYRLAFYSGRFFQSFQFKNRINIPSSQPIYLEPEILINNWDFIGSNDFLNESFSPTIIDQVDRKFGLNIGVAAGPEGKMVLGAAFFNNRDSYSNNEELVSSDTLDRLRFNGIKASMLYKENSLNRKQYASSGRMLETSIQFIAGQEVHSSGNTATFPGLETARSHRWVKLDAKYEAYFGDGRFKYGFYGHLSISGKPIFSNYQGTLINQPFFAPLNDSRTIFQENFRAFNFVGLGSRNVWSLQKSLDFRAELYGLIPFDNIMQGVNQEVVYSSDQISVKLAATVGAVYHSPIGPASFSVNYYDNPQRKFGALFHIGYLIFPKRSLE